VKVVVFCILFVVFHSFSLFFGGGDTNGLRYHVPGVYKPHFWLRHSKITRTLPNYMTRDSTITLITLCDLWSSMPQYSLVHTPKLIVHTLLLPNSQSWATYNTLLSSPTAAAGYAPPANATDDRARVHPVQVDQISLCQYSYPSGTLKDTMLSTKARLWW